MFICISRIKVVQFKEEWNAYYFFNISLRSSVRNQLLLEIEVKYVLCSLIIDTSYCKEKNLILYVASLQFLVISWNTEYSLLCSLASGKEPFKTKWGCSGSNYFKKCKITRDLPNTGYLHLTSATVNAHSARIKCSHNKI